MSRLFALPMAVLTDSYKVTHTFMYPDAQKMVAYGEFRASFDRDPEDTRIVFYGIRYIIENYIAVKWTMEEDYFAHRCNCDDMVLVEWHNQVVEEHDGYFPAKIEGLPEGSVVYPHVPIYQITTFKAFAPLITYLETLLTLVWYPTTVATLSRRVRDLIEEAFDKSTEASKFGLLGSVEQSIIGGCAHLVNFDGSDTLSAAYYAQFHLNDGHPVATSIPATEHSVMTAYHSEREALRTLITKFGDNVCACVMDSYDYAYALEKILPSVASEKLERGGFLVLRPDSGDPLTAVLMGLRIGGSVFQVLRGCGVIQGDGVSYGKIKAILKGILDAGYAADNVAFGMGGGLLQKVNRDTMSFATKLSHITYADGTPRDVMKYPKTDASKVSLPGELAVITNDEQSEQGIELALWTQSWARSSPHSLPPPTSLRIEAGDRVRIPSVFPLMD
ncbi:hypothetical protein H4R34_000602 [Dimargaris verticillata]|uniref:Nicotinamide phosphoribosyltransferase n=1 Tax=Dimargaris verticillata TaxID=2761393 RepID=A0A9W8B6C5_9FUNG|nr:hypothetical protein H4R34_000602 [Dimargaris verticillata]